MYDRNLLNAIKEELLEICDTKEESLNELKRYRKEFKYEKDYNIYQYGNIRPYYSQIRDLFKAVKHPSPEDNQALCEIFKRYIRKATDELLTEEKEK